MADTRTTQAGKRKVNAEQHNKIEFLLCKGDVMAIES